MTFLGDMQIKKKKVCSINGKSLKTALSQDVVLGNQKYKYGWGIHYLSTLYIVIGKYMVGQKVSEVNFCVSLATDSR